MAAVLHFSFLMVVSLFFVRCTLAKRILPNPTSSADLITFRKGVVKLRHSIPLEILGLQWRTLRLAQVFCGKLHLEILCILLLRTQLYFHFSEEYECVLTSFLKL